MRRVMCCFGVLSGIFFLLLSAADRSHASYPQTLEDARNYLNCLDAEDSLAGIYEMRKDDFHGFFLLLPAPEESLDDYEARVIVSSNSYEKPGDLKFFMRRTQEREVFFGKYYDYSSLGCCEARSGFVVLPGEISAREVQGFDRKPRVFVKIYGSPNEGDSSEESQASSSEESGIAW